MKEIEDGNSVLVGLLGQYDRRLDTANSYDLPTVTLGKIGASVSCKNGQSETSSERYLENH